MLSGHTPLRVQPRFKPIWGHVDIQYVWGKRENVKYKHKKNKNRENDNEKIIGIIYLIISHLDRFSLAEWSCQDSNNKVIPCLINTRTDSQVSISAIPGKHDVFEFYIIGRSHFSTAFTGLTSTQLVFLQRFSVCYITQSNGRNSYHIMRPDRREHYNIG